MRRSHRVLTFEIHLVSLLVFLAMITISFGISPQSASAEDNQKRAPNVAAPDPQGTPSKGYSLEEMDLRVKRARIGLISTASATAFGGLLFGIGYAFCVGKETAQAVTFGFDLELCSGGSKPAMGTGLVLMFGGAAGMIATGVLLGVRKRKRRNLREAHYARPRRVQWDPANSRVVF